MTRMLNLKEKCCAIDNQKGYTLLEMIFALAVLGLLILIAQPLLNIGFHQHSIMLKYREKEELPVAMQVLEDDILQMYGTRPWRVNSGIGQNNCIDQWEFDTENIVETNGPAIPITNIRYEVSNQMLNRMELKDGLVQKMETLLNGVNCMKIYFYQGYKWHASPNNKKIVALKIDMNWQGVDIERIWPINISADSYHAERDDSTFHARNTQRTDTGKQ